MSFISGLILFITIVDYDYDSLFGLTLAPINISLPKRTVVNYGI